MEAFTREGVAFVLSTRKPPNGLQFPNRVSSGVTETNASAWRPSPQASELNRPGSPEGSPSLKITQVGQFFDSRVCVFERCWLSVFACEYLSAEAHPSPLQKEANTRRSKMQCDVLSRLSQKMLPDTLEALMLDVFPI